MAASKKTIRASPQNRAYSTPVLVGILALVVLVLFSPSLTYGFVYDSRAQVLIGDFIHNRDNILPVLTFQVMSWDIIDFNRPVQLASLMFDSLIWGKNPFGYHLTNVVLHAIATCLTFLLIRHILILENPKAIIARQNFTAFLATLFFAVHPFVTEVVCEPSNRKDSLAAVFGLTALLLLTRHSAANSQGDGLRLVLGTLLSLLAIGTKEVGVVVPAIIFLYWFLFRRQEPAKFWIAAIAGSTLAAIAFLIARFSLAHQKSEVFLNPPLYPGGSLTAALLIQPRILTFYILNLFWPANLNADYDGYSIRFIDLLPALLILGVISAFLLWWSWKDRRAFFGAGIIAAAMLPVCNLVPIYHPMADRYLYIPLIGTALLVAIALSHPWMSDRALHRKIATFLVVAITAILSVVTLQREWAWSTDISLWQDTLRGNPRSFAALVNLPECLLDAGRLEESRAQYEATLRTPYKDNAWVWAGYAIILNRLGDQTHSKMAVERALAAKPDLLDTEKMVHTMQTDRNFAEEFARIAADFQKTPSQNP